MKIEYHIDDFISYCVEKGLSRKTYGSYEQTLILLARYLREKQGIDKVEEVKREHRCLIVLKNEQIAVIVEEIYTGTSINRKEWNKLVKPVVQRDTIVFDSVSRMSRNAQEGFEIYEELYSKGVDLVFLKEPHINTETYKTALENNIKLTGTNVDFILEGINKYLFSLAKEQIRLAFEQAEKEVKDLQQRTREGIETARLNGKQIGMQPGTKLTTKKSIAAKEIIQKHSKDFNGTLSDAEVMKLVGISRNSYYKYKRELRCGM